MFVALSQFAVVDGMADRVHAAFQDRPRLVEGADGFIRLEVMRPEDAPNEFWLLTYWTDGESFRRWHRSHLYKSSHAAIPRGLKLVRGSARLRYFTRIEC